MKKVTSFLKYQFRYKLSSIYIILGMVIGFISLYNGIGIAEYIKNYTNEINGNRYLYSCEVYLRSTEPFSIKKYLRDVDCIVRLDDIVAYIDAQDNCHSITAIISAGEKTNYSMVEGRLPNDEEIQNHEKVVAIGRKIKEDSFWEDGIRYILMEGEKYRVTGIIGTKNSDAQDYLIVTYYDCLGEKVFKRSDMTMTYYPLILESNYLNVEYRYPEIGNYAIEDGIEMGTTYVIGDGSRLTVDEENTKKVYMCLFGFSIVSCIMITNFWIYQRKRDIAIFRVLGYSKKMIIKKQMGEMLFHMACVLLVGIVIQNILNQFVDITYETSMTGLAEVAAIFVLVSMMLVIRPALKVMDEPPVYGINGK